MSDRTPQSVGAERAAEAMLKALSVAIRPGTPMDRAFARMPADAMAKGHAWRAIKLAIGPTLPAIWARRASHAATVRMLGLAAELVRDPRTRLPF